MSLWPALLSSFVLAGGGQDPDAATPVAPTAAPSSQTDATNLGEIEVLGQPGELRERVSAFVEDIAATPRNTGRARWREPVCVGVANLAQPYAQAVVDRVSQVALEIGLDVGEPGCRAGVMIFFAVDATPFAKKLVSDDYFGFRPGPGGSALGRKALQAFQEVERPVRWWQVSQVVEEATGNPPQEVTFFLPDGGVQQGNELTVPLVTVRRSSRLQSGLRNDMRRVILIVDVNRLGDASWASLADYVSMVALAQIDVEADMSGQPSILSLFSSRPAARGLTQWDTDYLRSLYAAPPDRRNPNMEARDIRNGMIRRVDRRAAQP